MEIGRRRSKRGRMLPLVVALFIGSAALGAFWLSGRRPAPTVLPTPTETRPPPPTLTRNPAGQLPELPSDATLLAEAPGTVFNATPADDWADALLDLIDDQVGMDSLVTDGLAWWQGGGVHGFLTLDDGTVLLIGDEQVDASQKSDIQIFIPDPFNPNQITPVGTILSENAALTLSILSKQSGAEDRQWRISGLSAQVALKALAYRSMVRENRLLVAYVEGRPETALLAITGIQPLDLSTPEGTLTPSPTLTPRGGVASDTPVPTWTRTPTATQSMNIFVERFVYEQFSEVLVEALDFSPNAVYELAFGHPRIGALTWTEFGAEVNGKATAVKGAQEMSFYSLVPGDVEGRTVRLFDVLFTEGTTRVPSEQVYFQGHRMEEILFWLVRLGADQGGQVIVLYDDFGVRQTITIVGFRLFESEREETP